jgi:hypothetical protein
MESVKPYFPLGMRSLYPELGKTSVRREERRRIAAKF